MQWEVEETGENEGDYSEKIKSERVSKWIYADTQYQWERLLFCGDRKTGSKVNADCIKDGVDGRFWCNLKLVDFVLIR